MDESKNTDDIDKITKSFQNLTTQDDSSNIRCFPRCEYKARFEGTSAFLMLEPACWGSYFRSTSRGGNCDRLAKELPKSKTFENTIVNSPERNKKPIPAANTGTTKKENTKINTPEKNKEPITADNTGTIKKENTKMNTPDKNKKHIPATKTGTIKSPWGISNYQEIFARTPINPKYTHENKINLYDHLLEYKKSICTIVIDNFNKQEIQNKKIEVYFTNGYPCIMVMITDFNEIKTETSSLYNIVIAYFAAIANNIAKSNKIPIELVIRSSFGHNIPSVTETGSSFRINVGIVPKIYAELVLVKSLIELNNKFLIPLLNSNSPNQFRLNLSEYIKQHNDDVVIYNNRKEEKKKGKEEKKNKKGKEEEKEKKNKDEKKEKKNTAVQKWDEQKDSLYGVLCKIGDASGLKVSYQIMRKKEYADLLADYIHKMLINKTGEECWANPLRRILKKISYTDTATLNVIDDGYNMQQFQFYEDEEHENIKQDDEFWEMMQSISLIFVAINITNLSSAVKDKKIFGLYSTLEKANLMFIKNSSYQQSEDGYGSDSDCEVNIKDADTSFYSKKLIVATGMRAINMALFLSICLTGSTKVDTKYMYYETKEAVKLINNVLQLLKIEDQTSDQIIRYIDLNHCCSSGPNAILRVLKDLVLKLSGEDKVIVFDYTSARTTRINKAVRLFIPKVQKAVLLVSSGLKNEQVGADMNPYGTIRIIAKDVNVLNGLYLLLKSGLDAGKEQLPKQLHNIRKAYKDAGAVITNNAIYGKDCKTVEKKLKNSNNTSKSSFLNEFVNIYHDFFSGKDVVSWQNEKIEFLGSPEVKSMIETVDNKDMIDFDMILKCYESDAEMTKSIVMFYNTDTDILLDQSFDSVFTIACAKKNLLSPIDADDILRTIVQENRQNCSSSSGLLKNENCEDNNESNASN